MQYGRWQWLVNYLLLAGAVLIPLATRRRQEGPARSPQTVAGKADNSISGFSSGALRVFGRGATSAR